MISGVESTLCYLFLACAECSTRAFLVNGFACFAIFGVTRMICCHDGFPYGVGAPVVNWFSASPSLIKKVWRRCGPFTTLFCTSISQTCSILQLLTMGYHLFYRWSFNLTLFMASIFGIAAGGSPNFVALASLVAVLGVGVGGNMPVDSAVFLGLCTFLMLGTYMT